MLTQKTIHEINTCPVLTAIGAKMKRKNKMADTQTTPTGAKTKKKTIRVINADTLKLEKHKIETEFTPAADIAEGLNRLGDKALKAINAALGALAIKEAAKGKIPEGSFPENVAANFLRGFAFMEPFASTPKKNRLATMLEAFSKNEQIVAGLKAAAARAAAEDNDEEEDNDDEGDE